MGVVHSFPTRSPGSQPAFCAGPAALCRPAAPSPSWTAHTWSSQWAGCLGQAVLVNRGGKSGVPQKSMHLRHREGKLSPPSPTHATRSPIHTTCTLLISGKYRCRRQAQRHGFLTPRLTLASENQEQLPVPSPRFSPGSLNIRHLFIPEF